MELQDAELVEAVLEGAFEQPLWGTFLGLLRARTASDHVSMIFRPPDRPLSEALHLFSGGRERTVQAVYARYLPTLDLLSDFGMSEGRAYAFDELYPPRNPRHDAFYREIVAPSGIRSARVIRVMERTGVSAWLTVSRRGADYDPSVSRLIEALAPPLRGSLRYYIALEHERLRSAIAASAMRSLHFAWLTLDAAGTIIDGDAEAEVVLTRSRVLSRRPNGRLAARPAQLHREMHEAIRRLAADPGASPRAMTLSQDPWLDMLLVPARQTRLTAKPAAIVAYIHGDSWRVSDRCRQISDLFGLSSSEARLALALSRGKNLEEAAGELGLSLETVRTYSKKIYAKTGARGLPDLVRILMRSVLAFAPDRPMQP